MEPQPSGMGEFSRLTGMFFEPKKTFKDIAERPRWIVPMLLLIVVTLIVLVVIGQKIGWDTVIRQQIEARMATMSDQQRTATQNNMAISIKFGTVLAYASGIFGWPILTLATAGVTILMVNVFMSAGLRFKQIFAIACYSRLPAIIASIATAAALMMKANPEEFNIQNPVPFNLGWFMAADTSAKFLHALATSIDLFTFWSMFLMATGLSVAAGKKLSFGSALMAVVLPWALFVLVRSAVAAI
jgi:hypothetical protein